MADPVLPLEIVFDAVKALFDDEGPPVACVFGWREVPKQINQGPGGAARVVFVPGLDGKAGEYMGARRPGRNPRPLRTLVESARVHCWAFDSTAPNDERAQYRAAMLLHDATVRAIELALRSADAPNVPGDGKSFDEPVWIRKDSERAFGAELAFTLRVEHAIFDVEHTEITNAQGQTTAVLAKDATAPGTSDGTAVIEQEISP